MNERTFTRLSYLFASMAATPELSPRFIERILLRDPPEEVLHLKVELLGWAEDHGPITHDALLAVATSFEHDSAEDTRTAGRMLRAAVDQVMPIRCVAKEES